MRFFNQLRTLFSRQQLKPLSEWYFVDFDDAVIRLRVEPPGGKPWSAVVPWESIIRVCFKAENLEASDGIYLFTADRPQSCAVPTEARGGGELWVEILRRELFDAQLAIDAATAASGVFCWPPAENAPE